MLKLTAFAGAFCALALCASEGAAADARPPVATTDSGPVAGTSEGAAVVFRAIPYAAPPVGALRWKPPQPPAHWTGVREARAPGPACAQRTRPDRPNEGGYIGPTSEDCLTLDVTAPVGVRKAPVMVWIYGGGNVAGAANLPSYDARNFARDGVVVVAMNYRLGPLGFFAHPALTAEAPAGQPLANYGLMDQIAALGWVRANIARFGGDPANVTIFGESAGGEDVLALMSIPAARPLFNKAIVESGLGWFAPDPLDTAEAQGVDLARRAGLGPTPTAADLRALPVQALIDQPWRAEVIVDGRLVAETATRAFARGDEAPVPLIIGSNSNEASLLGAFGATPQAWIAHTPAEVKSAYGPTVDDADLARQLFNDAVMAAPARWIARRQSLKAPTWLYYFSYVPERQRSMRPGTNHASEIPYVFDSLDQVPGHAGVKSASEQAQATLTHACWVAFAKVGRPDCAGGAWKPFAVADDRLFEFGDPAGPREAFRKPQLDAQEAHAAVALDGR